MNAAKTKGAGTLDVALDYVAKHKGQRFIFPLAPGRKGRPLLKDNLNRASNDPDEIERWHGRWPGCAWGCASKKSGVVCVDIDGGNGKQGMKSVTSLRQAGFRFPKTERERSPSGGWHLIYQGAHHFSASKIGLHIDTPNYFLFGGNVRYDGKAYIAVSNSQSVPLPAWIAEKIRPRADRQRREPSGELVPVDLFVRMLRATPYVGGPNGLDDRHNYQGWSNFSMAVHEAAGGDEGEYLDAYIDWCLLDPAAHEGWTAEQIVQHWQSYTADTSEGQAAITRASWFKVLSYFGKGDLISELALACTDFVDDPYDEGDVRKPAPRNRPLNRNALRRHRAIAFARE